MPAVPILSLLEMDTPGLWEKKKKKNELALWTENIFKTAFAKKWKQFGLLWHLKKIKIKIKNQRKLSGQTVVLSATITQWAASAVQCTFLLLAGNICCSQSSPCKQWASVLKSNKKILSLLSIPSVLQYCIHNDCYLISKLTQTGWWREHLACLACCPVAIEIEYLYSCSCYSLLLGNSSEPEVLHCQSFCSVQKEC